MGIVFINENTPLPDPTSADRDGLLAFGGSLTIHRLIESYSKGIFPWYSEGEPVMWWSPDPRIVLFPNRIHVSRKMKKLLRNNAFRVTMDKNFEEVIENCLLPRKKDEGTWITQEMKISYSELFREGYAHSVEVWLGETLVGGLYGISLGRVFFGESMFFTITNASKYGFIKLANYLQKEDFLFIDCQVDSPHLRSLGACPVQRHEFLKLLKSGLGGERVRKTIFPEIL